MERSADPAALDFQEAAVRSGPVRGVILKRGKDRADRQQSKQNYVPDGTFFIGYRFARAAMGAFAAFGCYRHLAQAAASQLFVGTSHSWKLDI